MKKILCMILCIFPVLVLSACLTINTTTTQIESFTQTTASEPSTTTTPGVTTTGSTPAGSTAEPSDTTPETAVPTTADISEPSNSATLYTSYAFMKSFDPARGWADFDYFEMLRGDDAVQWLVDHEGYTFADAQDTVDNFADSEFITKNTNPVLRTIDLRELPLKMMFHPDGSMVEDANPIDATISDLYALYAHDPELVLNSFFYFIEVDGGEVVSVEQVYWP